MEQTVVGLAWGVAAWLVVTIGAAGAQQSPAPIPAPQAVAQAPADMALAEDDGTLVFRAMCTRCHAPDRILAERRTRIQWEEVFEKMVTVGAMGTDEQWDTVQTYLLRHYSRVNVNRAPADDIAIILGVPAADATAIVAFRKAHGDFADFDALARVPGIDREKLERNRKAVSF